MLIVFSTTQEKWKTQNVSTNDIFRGMQLSLVNGNFVCMKYIYLTINLHLYL